MSSIPIMLVSAQRALGGSKLVVQGPSFSPGPKGGYFHWSTNNSTELSLHNPTGKATPVRAVLDPDSPEQLASDEMFGYDPVTTDCPVLRKLQSYTSAILKVDAPGSNLIGLVALPQQADAQFVRCRMRVDLAGWASFADPLAEDLRRADKSEMLVLKWEGDANVGYFILSAHHLVSGLRFECEGTLVSFSPIESIPSGRLYYSESVREQGSRRKARKQLCAGECEPVPLA